MEILKVSSKCHEHCTALEISQTKYKENTRIVFTISTKQLSTANVCTSIFQLFQTTFPLTVLAKNRFDDEILVYFPNPPPRSPLSSIDPTTIVSTIVLDRGSRSASRSSDNAARIIPRFNVTRTQAFLLRIDDAVRHRHLRNPSRFVVKRMMKKKNIYIYI